MKNIKVREAKRELLPDLDLVTPSTDLSKVFEIFKFHTVTRVLFVVDSNGKLMGMINIQTLLKILASASVKQESLTFFSEVSARTAEDVMVRPLSLREEDTLEKALQLMVESKTEDVAVMDSAGKMVGTLNCFDILGKLTE